MERSLIQPIRDHDYERYLACLMAPAAQHHRLFTILAFNHELAKTAEAASEPAVGAIRLKWWEEALTEIEADRAPRKHPVVQALTQLDDASPLYALIEPRMKDIEHRQGFMDSEAFFDYVNETAGTLHCVLADEDSEVIREAAIFYGLVGLLRAMPYHLERGIVRFPKDVLKRYGISPAAIEAGVEKEAFTHFMGYWMEELQRRAEALREPIKATPELIKRLHILALLYAQALKKAGGDPTRVPRRLANLPLKLWWMEKRGLYRLP